MRNDLGAGTGYLAMGILARLADPPFQGPFSAAARCIFGARLARLLHSGAPAALIVSVLAPFPIVRCSRYKCGLVLDRVQGGVACGRTRPEPGQTHADGDAAATTPVRLHCTRAYV